MKSPVVLIAAVVAAGLVLFLVSRSKDAPLPQAVVRIEAPDELCWDSS